MRVLLVSPILALLLAGCPEKQAATGSTKQPAKAPSSKPEQSSKQRGNDPSDRDHVDADGVVRRGETLSEAQPLTVTDVHAKAEELAGKTVKVTGTVKSVCVKKGCWFVLEQGGQAIRITSKGYKFFVPTKAPGMTATIEGELAVKEIDQATAQHYEDERVMGSGEKPKQITGPQHEVSIAAIGLEMKS